MTGKLYAEEVLRRLSGGNISDDFEIKAEDLYPTINNALKDTLIQYAAQTGNNLNGGWVLSYPCESLTESCVCGCPVWYWDLPVDILQLANDGGVVLVRNKYYAEYTRVSLEMLPQTLSLPVASGAKLFWIEGKRLFFTKKDTIFVSVIPTAKDALELAVPAGFGQVFENLVWEQAIKFLIAQKDISNNASMVNLINNDK